MERVYRGLGVLAVLALVGVLGVIGKAWYDSRLPDTFSAMDMGVPDYGGGRRPPRISTTAAEVSPR